MIHFDFWRFAKSRGKRGSGKKVRLHFSCIKFFEPIAVKSYEIAHI